MENLQLRFELYSSLQQWVNNTMAQFNISAAQMEDAVNSILVNLHNKVIEDYLIQQQQQQQLQEAASSSFEPEEIDSEESEDATIS